MKINNLQPFSLNEYPGEICAVVFTQGCNFDCKYCFNPELKPEEQPEGNSLDMEEVLGILKGKKERLTAVSITGGEPLEQSDLIEFLAELKNMDFKVKLNTNGSYNMRLKSMIDYNLIDFIRMDIKAPPDKYEDVICCPVRIDDINDSIKLIKKAGIDHEFYTVMDKDVLDDKDIEKIREWIKDDKNYKVGEKK